MLGPQPYQLNAKPHMHAKLATQRNDRAAKWAGAVIVASFICVEAIAFTKVSRLLSWVSSWLVEQKESSGTDLDYDWFRASLMAF